VGALDGTDISNLDFQCQASHLQWSANYGPNTQFDRASNQAVTFGGAVTVFGVGLNAQSGFSQYVSSHWNFGNDQLNHWLCGNDNYITSSTRIFAGK
jgi:hypothetical protein